MDFILYILSGFIVGTILSLILVRMFTGSGSLYIDTSDPSEEPYVFLELDESINTILQSDYVRLKVKHRKHVSHK